MNRVEAIRSIVDAHPTAFFVFSNGLTSREAADFCRNDRSLYLLHAMGEALSVGMGLAAAQPELAVVVVDGDGNALMGMASWSMYSFPNLTYYVLDNQSYETTGSQAVPEPPAWPAWCHVIRIEPGKQKTPNPPSPDEIWATTQKWLMQYHKVSEEGNGKPGHADN